jgi:hypothetical protein
MCAGMKEGRKQGKLAGNYTTKPMCAGRKEASKQAGKAHEQEKEIQWQNMHFHILQT